MRNSLVPLITLALLLPGCSNAPEPSRPGMGLVYGDVTARGPAGLPANVAVDYDAEDEGGDAVPAGAKLVDYDKPGPAVFELRGGVVGGGGEARLTLGPDGFDRALVALGVGGQLTIANNTNNVVTLIGTHKGKSVLELAVPAGGSAWTAITQDGVVEIASFEDEDISTTVYVAKGPYAYIKRVDRRFVIDFVPPGEYELVAWHPRFPAITTKVTVVADESTAAHTSFGVSGQLPTVDK